eukprot:3941635-Rhodomonas_salina.1
MPSSVPAKRNPGIARSPIREAFGGCCIRPGPHSSTPVAANTTLLAGQHSTRMALSLPTAHRRVRNQMRNSTGSVQSVPEVSGQ